MSSSLRQANGRRALVFEASTKPELLQRWWAPKSFGVSFISCEADVRAGGSYRFVFGHPASEQPMEFFGRYIEVTPHSRLVWTNDEGGEGGEGGAVTTVTFEERGPDPGRLPRPLSLEGSSRRCHRLREYKPVWRVVRATRCASRHPGHERGTVMKSGARMAKLIFSMNQSLDGYVDHTAFAPSPKLFRHFIEQVGGLTGSIYSHAMYEMMRYWDEDSPDWDAEERDFAAAWRRRPKWVVSRSLKSVGPRRLSRVTLERWHAS